MLGYLSLSNTGGIAILEIIHGIDDEVIAQIQGTEKVHAKPGTKYAATLTAIVIL